MILRALHFGRVAALLCIGLGFGAVPSAAQACGYGCYWSTPVVVQPYYYPSCSCCGCGSAYYASYYPAYAYPYWYGYGYSYGAAYGYEDTIVGPRIYRPYRRYFGARWRY